MKAVGFHLNNRDCPGSLNLSNLNPLINRLLKIAQELKQLWTYKTLTCHPFGLLMGSIMIFMIKTADNELLKEVFIRIMINYKCRIFKFNDNQNQSEALSYTNTNRWSKHIVEFKSNWEYSIVRATGYFQPKHKISIKMLGL